MIRPAALLAIIGSAAFIARVQERPAFRSGV